MENQLDFYKSFHTHPINQGIHTICIPSIVLCVLNYASLLRIHFEFLKGKPKTISSWYNTSLEDLISIFYTITILQNLWNKNRFCNVYLHTSFIIS